jgi:hypothetical protein
MSPLSAFAARHHGRTLLDMTVLSVSASLPARSLMAPATHAAMSGCRSDPVVTLSNRNRLGLSTVATDTYADVQQVSYTLHGRAGTWVTSEVDSSMLGPNATFHCSCADEPPSTHSAGSKIDPPAPQIPVAPTRDLVSVNGTLLSTAWVSGQNPQTLWMTVSG